MANQTYGMDGIRSIKPSVSWPNMKSALKECGATVRRDDKTNRESNPIETTTDLLGKHPMV